MLNEGELVARAQRGDAPAFETLMNEHASFVYNLAWRVVRDSQEAEDLAQEAFIRAWKGLPRFQGKAKFSTWLYRIVTNLCYNRLPHMKRELAALDPDDAALALPDEYVSVERQVLDLELRQELHSAIAKLPERYRLLITLRHLQEMSYNEIALVTDLPLGTVKTGIFRARQRLAQVIVEKEHEPA
jgi:RNA polymerase sigma-70 factor (ECF subfamily)